MSNKAVLEKLKELDKQNRSNSSNTFRLFRSSSNPIPTSDCVVGTWFFEDDDPGGGPIN